MKGISKTIFQELGFSLLFGLMFGIIFGFVYGNYVIILTIAITIGIIIWFFNTLLRIFLIPRIEKFTRGKKLIIEISSFFISSILGFIIPVAVYSRIFQFKFFGENIFFFNLGLILILYLMISGVVYSFRFYKELKEKEIAAEKHKALAAQGELQSLKSQINPHFLFNTLNSINALVTHNPKLARNMIASLSELLRISLQNHKKMRIPLKKELEFVHLYLEMEKIRFNEKMEYQEKVSPELMDIPFPSMVLQPLVENAVKHGIASSRKGGIIQLTLEHKGNWLRVRISNTVKKYDRSKSMDKEAHGTGLTNIHQRLELLFKNNVHFHAGYLSEDRFEVRFALPLDEIKDNREIEYGPD